MARRLLNIIQSSVGLAPNDVIYFTFKKHKFSAYVTGAGLIHNVTWEKPNENISVCVFPMRTFESLTDWTETCIQEKLDEYHTRYSAWRRVRHFKTNKPMEELYKDYQRLKLSNANSKKLNASELQQLNTLSAERILYLEKCLEKRDETIEQWNVWCKTNHTGEEIPIAQNAPVKKQEPTIMETPQPRPQMQVQPIVLNSPGGAYITIQRIKETNPQAAQIVKQLGLNGFRDMTKKFAASNKVWFPPSNEDWYNKSVSEISNNQRMVASVVHEFFKK